MTDHIEIPTRMLVHALIREDGSVDADELYTVANTLGMSDQQVRLCVKRLVTEGRFTHEGRGRKARLHATADTTRTLAPNADFLRHAFRQDAGHTPWDGVWHLAGFALPESARTARDSLRETLVHLGGAPLQGGLYVCANAWEPYVEEAAHRLGAHDALTLLTTTDLRKGTTQEPAELARCLWPLQEIADRYHRLTRIAQPRLARLTGPAALSPSTLLTIAVELAAELTRAMEPEPLLPPQLLPHPWPGTHARHLVARCWAALHERDHGETRPALFHLYTDITREAAERATH
ncbi:PaaX family transcriptional regulator C-terminal domain-containing protein [Streptomyces sp. NPDC017529]|uniref:PaaX family transcriptional regulator C-terminal domain-containing protein n=1 Tax=Streptomyces sp. NPDC017529 TaxID=3365000 RepID=UPI0037A2B923